jgi:hypothetical protein
MGSDSHGFRQLEAAARNSQCHVRFVPKVEEYWALLPALNPVLITQKVTLRERVETEAVVGPWEMIQGRVAPSELTLG